jgi:transcription elongation GreA/GreB family factor
MKKVLLLVALMFLIIITTSCQKPEEITLSKYFQAMKAKDRDTMASMAAEPMALEFKSWELVSSEAPVTEDLILPQLLSTQADIKIKKDKQIGIVKDKKDALDLLKTKLGETRGSRQKAELQKQVDVSEQEMLAETANYKQAQVEYTQMKNQVEVEKKMVTMSTSIEQNQELMTGKAVTVKAIVKITTASGDKDYVFILRKYELINPLNNKISPNRFIILKIQTKEDFEQGK